MGNEHNFALMLEEERRIDIKVSILHNNIFGDIEEIQGEQKLRRHINDPSDSVQH